MIAETGQTLGEFLRQEREKRGMTIEQVASATKINVRMLHALEADHFADLPAKPFVRGFVTSYCRFIGLSPKEILTRYGSFIEEKAHDRPNRDAGHSGYAFEKREGEQSRTVLWFVMGGFITFGAVIFVFLKPSLHHHHMTHVEKLQNALDRPSPSPSPGVSSVPAASATAPATLPAPSPSVAAPIASVLPPLPPEPVAQVAIPNSDSAAQGGSPAADIQAATSAATPTATPTPANSPPTTPGDNPYAVEDEPANKADPLASGVGLSTGDVHHKVVFKAHDDVWVRYRVDGKPVMRFILRRDRVLVLKAKKAIQFQTSEPTAITFNHNGQGSKSMDDVVARQKRHDSDATLFFPPELSNFTKVPFPGDKKIVGASVPPPRQPPSLSTPAQ